MPRDFSQVDTWVFDLDNTLYPHHLNLWEQVDERIRDYIANFLKLSHDEAFKLQKDYYRRYGTSMRGMMIEHGMDADDFLASVTEADEADWNLVLVDDAQNHSALRRAVQFRQHNPGERQRLSEYVHLLHSVLPCCGV